MKRLVKHMRGSWSWSPTSGLAFGLCLGSFNRPIVAAWGEEGERRATVSLAWGAPGCDPALEVAAHVWVPRFIGTRLSR